MHRLILMIHNLCNITRLNSLCSHTNVFDFRYDAPFAIREGLKGDWCRKWRPNFVPHTFFSLFLFFFRDDNEHRGWCDSSQSVLRPGYEARPIASNFQCMPLWMYDVLRCPAARPCVRCILRTFFCLFYSVQHGPKFLLAARLIRPTSDRYTVPPEFRPPYQPGHSVLVARCGAQPAAIQPTLIRARTCEIKLK